MILWAIFGHTANTIIYLHNQGHDACVIAPVPLCCNELRMATETMVSTAKSKTQHGTCHKTAKIDIIKGGQGICEWMWIQEKVERKNNEKHQTKEVTPNIDYIIMQPPHNLARGHYQKAQSKGMVL